MIATVETSILFAGTSAVLEFKLPVKQAIIFVPALSTDTELKLSVSYDEGTTYLQLNRIEGSDNETDVQIKASKCQVIDLAGARFVKLTGSNAQTCTVYAIGLPY